MAIQLLSLYKWYKLLFQYIFVFFSVLVKYGANYSIEDNDGILADELALVYHANECHRFINTHRTQRMNHLVSLIAQVSHTHTQRIVL